MKSTIKEIDAQIHGNKLNYMGLQKKINKIGVDITADHTLEKKDHFRVLSAEIEQFNAAKPGNTKSIEYVNEEPIAVFVKDARPKNK